MKTLFWYLKDEAIGLAFWVLGMSVLICFIVAIYPEMGGVMENVIFNVSIVKFFVSQFAPDLVKSSPLDAFLGLEFFTWFTIMTNFFSLIFASETIAGYTEKRTMELLLAQPISRSRVLLEKYAAIAILLAVFCMACFGVLVAAIRLYLPETPSTGAYARTFLNSYFLILAFTAFGFLCSTLIKSRRIALSVSITFVLFTFIFYKLLSAFKIANWFTCLLPYHYADPIKILAADGIHWWDNFILIAIAVGCLVAALVIFRRKDIAA